MDKPEKLSQMFQIDPARNTVGRSLPLSAEDEVATDLSV